jgi:hypothetical protein
VFEIKLKTLRFGDGGVQNAFAHVADAGYLKMRDDLGPETYLILFQTRTDGPSDIAWHYQSIVQLLTQEVTFE